MNTFNYILGPQFVFFETVYVTVYLKMAFSF